MTALPSLAALVKPAAWRVPFAGGHFIRAEREPVQRIADNEGVETEALYPQAVVTDLLAQIEQLTAEVRQ